MDWITWRAGLGLSRSFIGVSCTDRVHGGLVVDDRDWCRLCILDSWANKNCNTAHLRATTTTTVVGELEKCGDGRRLRVREKWRNDWNRNQNLTARISNNAVNRRYLREYFSEPRSFGRPAGLLPRARSAARRCYRRCTIDYRRPQAIIAR